MRVRINSKGEITLTWSEFLSLKPDEVMDVVRKKGRNITQAKHKANHYGNPRKVREFVI